MPLTDEQKTLLRSKALEHGVDANALIAEAERQSQSGDAGSASADAKPGAPPKTDRPLYMYHLPFVTVNEVRTVWLGLDPIAGGDEFAAKFAAAQGGQSKPTDPTA